MQEYPHRVELVLLGPAEFDIDAVRVEGVGLKHLELVDGVRGDVVGADGPGLRLIPTVGSVSRPPALLCGGARHVRQRRPCPQQHR